MILDGPVARRPPPRYDGAPWPAAHHPAGAGETPVEPEHPAPPLPSSSLLPGGAWTGPDAPEGEVVDAFLRARGPRPAWVTLDAGHDCAVVDGDHALKVDTVVGGVHFDERWDPADVGYKAVAAAVSDLGAAGARPRWLLVSVSVRDPAWARRAAVGVGEACAAFGVYLVGGDVTRVPPGAPPVVSASVGGRCVAAPGTRAGAREGDDVWVTGALGLAGLGWWDPAAPPEALRALRRPTPPVAFALELAAQGLVAAAMDVSDGLASDAPRLAAASGVHLQLDPARLPIAPAVAARPDALRLAVGGGDDLELLFVARPGHAAAIEAAAHHHGVRATRIGSVLAGSGASLSDGDRSDWPAPLFAHFAGAT